MLHGTALTLFDVHFAVDGPDWPQVDDLFSNIFCSRKKQEEVSNELALLRIAQFREESKGVNEALETLVDKISKLYPLPIPSDKNEVVQKRSFRQAESGTDWRLHVETATKNSFYQDYVDSFFATIKTMKHHNDNAKESSASHCILYVRQKRFGNYLSRKYTSKRIPSAFEKIRQEPYNRCFNCWAKGCSALLCKKLKNPSIIKNNING